MILAEQKFSVQCFLLLVELVLWQRIDQEIENQMDCWMGSWQQEHLVELQEHSLVFQEQGQMVGCLQKQKVLKRMD